RNRLPWPLRAPTLPLVPSSITLLDTHPKPRKLAALVKYRSNLRVAGIQMGFGHLGTWNAQPSNGGGDAFINEHAWTLDLWEDYVKDVIGRYRSFFTLKPLRFAVSPRFIDGYMILDHTDTAKSIMKHAAEQGAEILLSGVHPDRQMFDDSGIPYFCGLSGHPDDRSRGVSDRVYGRLAIVGSKPKRTNYGARCGWI
ncbi:MAG: hypothetical protein ACREV4_13760, partial [Gammaproteobacteria bacterium]